MSTYFEPRDILGPLFGVRWINITKKEIEDLKNGCPLDINLEIKILKDREKRALKQFFQGRIESSCDDEYTALKLSNVVESDFLKSEYSPFKMSLLTLRLLKPGILDQNIAFYMNTGTIGVYYNNSASYNLSKKFPLGLPFYLQIIELNRAKQLYNKIKKINFKIDNKLNVAIDKFNRCYMKSSTEDRILNIITGMEVLFEIKEGKKIGRQIFTKCSDLISKNKKYSKIIRKNITEAYRLRNLILHQGIKFNPGYIEPIYEKCENYLRKSIHNIIMNY